mmetsp:Transcript_5555/g.4706  ORF Transcript_5555/g.4706 Transcript_5555/m.4706 type:complete len:270 (-) Transcript_5555:55-864(-)|eukprot:CAMPEP_0114575692 /NCGR_PEP_ID=MMETSP0125-20121206/540_1 /TAXON_ID=485358 ORGANISM="Aristerostoma sp., Strain ATCC 50986" /NCGR_SAMPLE_ID=MMETSP0125 /ASSEMBLY_ACC=CAM_ASM_000245 /LENGTH=269 /DNA_ID=CAMNT_0001763633 /DNA_START=294 /DNA_END=1103 /DNA_ORIENTATION=-
MVMGNDQNRAILDGCWSPVRNKFCFGTGSYKVYIGYVDPDNQWWVAELLCRKKFSSSVLSVQYHPSGNAIAAGSSDGTIRIYTSYIHEVDKDLKSPYSGPLADVNTRGDELFRIDANSWVESISFSPSGTFAMATAHNGNVVEFNIQGTEITANEEAIIWDKLPFRTGVVLDDNTFLAAGYDMRPTLFKREGGKWKFSKDYKKEGKDTEKRQSVVQSNLSMFERGKKAPESTKKVKVGHSVPIISVQRAAEKGLFYSVDSHGNFFAWPI